MKTDEELKQLAKDLYKGEIFTDRQINDSRLLRSVFIPLSLFDEEQAAQFRTTVENGKVNLLYERINKAGPRSINGMPIFMSFQTLDTEETKKLFEYYQKIKEVIDSV